MKYIQLSNGNKIDFHDYTITNACLVRFVNGNYLKIKEFFGKSIISNISILDENLKITEEKELNMKYSKIFTENTTIKKPENKLISEGYDSEVKTKVVDGSGNPILDSNGNETFTTSIVHHDALYEIVYKDVPVEMTTVILEPAKQEDQIEELKNYVGIINENTLDLDGWKKYKQEENKLEFKNFLDKQTVMFNNMEYGVSEEDQNEMALNLFRYKALTEIGQSAVLEWHSKKKKCAPFTINEYVALSSLINAFVYPFFNKMQIYKEKIYSCNSIEEVKKISFSYLVEA